jgi:hypothetical protein
MNRNTRKWPRDFRESEAKLIYLFVPALPVTTFGSSVRGIYTKNVYFVNYFTMCEKKVGPASFFMDTPPFRDAVSSIFRTAASITVIDFYGPIFLVILFLALILSR